MSEPGAMGRPPVHGIYSLERAIEERRIDPLLERELVESARDIIADDGRWEDQPARRRAIAERLAVLRLLLQTADAFLLRGGLTDQHGNPRGILKAYTGLTNAYVRAATQLGLEKRTSNGKSLEEYLRERESGHAGDRTGGQASTPTGTETPESGSAGEKGGHE